MSINNIHQLAEHFGTTRDKLTQILSNRARRDLYIAENITNLRIETFVGDLNTTFEIVCHYPFEPEAVEVFVDTIEHTCTTACDEAFGNNVDIVANMTDGDPLGGLTVEEAARLIEEAKQEGYSVSPDLTPEEFVNIYYDLYPEADREEV